MVVLEKVALFVCMLMVIYVIVEIFIEGEDK